MEKLKDFKLKIDKLNPDQPISDEQMKHLASIILSEEPKLKEHISSKDKDLNPLELGYFKMFLMRLEMMSEIKVTRGASIMMMLLIENPGMAILYAYYVHRKLNGVGELNIDNFSMKLFPWGSISPSQNEELWTAQKINTKEDRDAIEKFSRCGFAQDNLLDYVESWEI